MPSITVGSGPGFTTISTVNLVFFLSPFLALVGVLPSMNGSVPTRDYSL